VAFGASAATTFGLFDLEFWWELSALITIMLLGHWLEMRAIGQARGALAALAELLPDEAERKRRVEASLLEVFRRWGYREIVTPTFEFAEVLAVGTDVAVQDSMFTLVDRETGRVLALRSATSAVAIAATQGDPTSPVAHLHQEVASAFARPEMSRMEAAVAELAAVQQGVAEAIAATPAKATAVMCFIAVFLLHCAAALPPRPSSRVP